MEEKFFRNIFYYKNYYLDFFRTLKPEVQRKFNWTLKLIGTIERVPAKFLDHLKNTSGIYEVRVEVGTDIYRVLFFLMKENL